MFKYIVWRKIGLFGEMGGDFETLIAARAYAHKCQGWGYDTWIYRVIEKGKGRA